METPIDKTVWIYHPVLKFLTVEASAKAPMETGGVLMGYFAQPENTPVVLLATGPGSQAVHQRNYYKPDYEFDESQIATLYEKYGGKIIYLGDWHTHAASFPELSYKDKRTLRRIAGCKSARVETPIMLILSYNGQWDATIWQGKLYKKCVWGKHLVISNLTVNLIHTEKSTIVS